jgi:CheY-like chemotaxis protein
LVLDLGLPDLSGLELLREMGNLESSPLPAVIVYTGRVLTEAEHRDLLGYAEGVVLKDASSPERLLEELALVHCIDSLAERGTGSAPHSPRFPDRLLGDRRILVVDDDLRNTFSLAKVLRGHGMDVDIAENGAMALEKLTGEERFDVVLMDVMMPVMDGHEATRRIREIPRLARLPILALTAKAMRADRARCIEAGASDYLAKPVDVKHLMARLRILVSGRPRRERRGPERPWSGNGSGGSDPSPGAGDQEATAE